MLKRLKRLGLSLLILIIIVVPIVFMGPGIIKRKLQTEAYAKSLIELDFDKIKFHSLNPLKVSINEIKLKKRGEMDVFIQSITSEINMLDILTNFDSKFIQFNFIVSGVYANLKLKSEPQQDTSFGISTANLNSSLGKLDLKDHLKTNYGIVNLNVLVKLAKFDFNVDSDGRDFRLYGNESSIKLQSVDKPIELDLSANLTSKNSLGPLNSLFIPIKSQSQFALNHGVIRIIKSNTTIAGIQSAISAQLNLETLDFDASAKIHVPNLESIEFIKRNEAQLPISDTRGSLLLELGARGNAHSLPFTQGKGQLTVKSFNTKVKYKDPDLKLQGPVSLDLVSSFTYVNRSPAITSATWKLNMTETEIGYKDLFSKKGAVKLESEGTLSYLNDITLERFRLWFHTLDVTVKGMASELRASDLAVNIKPLKLQDFKEFLPNNKDFDISGDVELDGQIKGFLKQPKYLTINLRKIQANNLKYFLKFKNDLFSLDGPISLTVLGNILIERAQVLTGSITGHSDLTSLVVKKNNVVVKTAEDLLKANWSVHAKEGRLNIEKLYLNSFLAAFTIKGLPPLSGDDVYNLSVDLESMNWKKIKPMLPPNEWLDTISDMNNKGTFAVKGKLDPFQSFDTQFSVDANVETTIDNIALPFNFHLSKKPPADPNMPEPTLKAQEAFVKNAILLRKIRWNQKMTIQSLAFKDAGKFQNITLTANLANNSLRIKGDIKSIFNGNMAFTDVVVPLADADPKIQYTLSSSNLSFSPLIEFVMPDYKDLISGVANFEVTGVSKMPGTLNFKNDLTAKGRYRIPTSQVHTLKLIDEVKQKFSLIKGAGLPGSMPVSNLTASTESDFEIKNSQILLTGFKVVARNNDEIELNGRVQFDLNSKINGVLRLINVPLHGDFLHANQNQSGQLEIPITIEGNLKQPQWSFASNTLDKMTQNFIDYQKNKAQALVDRKVAEVKNQAQLEVEKQKKAATDLIEKKKKDLENDARKKLGDLFK